MIRSLNQSFLLLNQASINLKTMASYTSKLKSRKEVAEGTMEFCFDKPENFVYKAGQHIVMKLINPVETDAEGNERVFSLVSAPDEKEISVATRMRNTAFKRVLKTMPLGTEVSIDGPYGSFTLHNDSTKPAVFLAGGIGITPFVSMVRDAAKKKLPHKIFLFYSNRRPEDSAFLTELQELEKENPNYHFIGTMTDMAKSALSWTGKQGYINEAMIQEQIGDLAKPIYYLAGPPAMVAAMRGVLAKIGVNDDNIRTEEFSGY